MTEPTAAVPAEERADRGGLVFTLVPLAALVGVGLFFAAESSWYRIFLAVHVVAAVVWVGGGVAMTFLALGAARARDESALARIVKHEELLGKYLYGPASLVLVAFGIVLVENHDWSWSSFWIVFGLVAWVFSTIVGMGFFGPQMRKVNPMIVERGAHDPEVQRLIARTLQVARIDLTMLVLALLAMTAKPFS